MRKIFTTIALCAATLMASAADYVLDPATIYADILSGANTNVKLPVGTKYEMNDHVVSGIFTVYSPANRMMRIDLADTSPVAFADGFEATHRLEPNGATNTTNGRIIYIDCPSSGTLKVYAWATSADRGYTVNTASAVGATPDATPLYSTNAAMEITTAPHPVHEYAIASAGMIALVPKAGFYYGRVVFTDETSSVGSIQNPANYTLLPNGIQVEGSATNVRIYNLAGHLIKESAASFVPTETLAKGVYLVNIVTDGNKSSVKIVR